MQTTFTPENFKETFKPTLMKWTRNYVIFIGAVILSVFTFHHTVPYAVSAWGINVLRIIDYGKSVGGGIAVGINAVGIIAIGVNTPAGVVSIGVNAIGIVAIGVNAIGIVAIGTNAFGIYSLGANAYGIVAMGWHSRGIYSFSYTEKGKGRYLLAPHRQDPKAVAFFLR